MALVVPDRDHNLRLGRVRIRLLFRVTKSVLSPAGPSRGRHGVADADSERFSTVPPVAVLELPPEGLLVRAEPMPMMSSESRAVFSPRLGDVTR